jgi:hypothetical protein
MCTSFIYRKENTIIAMNFDNDGKDALLSSISGNDFIVSVYINNHYYPSYGINSSGIFVNDLLSDETGKGKYLRRNGKRIASTYFLQEILYNRQTYKEVIKRLDSIEVCNNPNMCSHNMIASKEGECCIVEHGVSCTKTTKEDSPYVVMTNFPLIKDKNSESYIIKGSGSDRYEIANKLLSKYNTRLEVEDAFSILEKVSQKEGEWTTEMSLVFDIESNSIFFCLDRKYNNNFRYDIANNIILTNNGNVLNLSKKGLSLKELSNKE